MKKNAHAARDKKRSAKNAYNNSNIKTANFLIQNQRSGSIIVKKKSLTPFNRNLVGFWLSM